jgi:hypothetical protein
MKKISPLILLFLIPIISQAQKTHDFHLDETYSIGAQGSLELSADDADVTIVGENRNDVHVKVDYNVTTKGLEWGNREFRVEVINDGGNLSIKEYRKGSSTTVGFVSSEYTIVIKAPIGVSLDIKGDDDDYSISSIAGNISLNADDADVNLKNCTGSDFYFDLDDGDIKMDRGKGTLKVRMDDGDIEILNGAFEEIDYRSDDGHLGLETSIGPNALYRFSGDDSDFDIVITQGGGTFTINHDNGRIAHDNNFRLVNKEEDKMELSLTGGRAKVIFTGDDISVSLTSTGSN